MLITIFMISRWSWKVKVSQITSLWGWQCWCREILYLSRPRFGCARWRLQAGGTALRNITRTTASLFTWRWSSSLQHREVSGNKYDIFICLQKKVFDSLVLSNPSSEVKFWGQHYAFCSGRGHGNICCICNWDAAF